MHKPIALIKTAHFLRSLRVRLILDRVSMLFEASKIPSHCCLQIGERYHLRHLMGGRLPETASKVELLCVLADSMNNHATNDANTGGGDHSAARVPDDPPPDTFAPEPLVAGQRSAERRVGNRGVTKCKSRRA